METNLTSVEHFPYFEGDFWPKKIEEIIEEVENEEMDRTALNQMFYATLEKNKEVHQILLLTGQHLPM